MDSWHTSHADIPVSSCMCTPSSRTRDSAVNRCSGPTSSCRNHEPRVAFLAFVALYSFRTPSHIHALNLDLTSASYLSFPSVSCTLLVPFYTSSIQWNLEWANVVALSLHDETHLCNSSVPTEGIKKGTNICIINIHTTQRSL